MVTEMNIRTGSRGRQARSYAARVLWVALLAVSAQAGERYVLEATARPEMPHWMLLNVPMRFKSGSGTVIQTNLLPSTLRIKIAQMGQVLVLVETAQKQLFFTIYDPGAGLAGQVGEVSLAAPELADAHGLRRPFVPGKASIRQIIVWQDAAPIDGQSGGWVEAGPAAPPAVEKGPKKFDDFLPAQELAVVPVKGIASEAINHMRRILPPGGGVGETWILPEAGEAYLAKDDGSVYRIGGAIGSGRVLDADLSGTEDRWLGTAWSGLWRLRNTQAVRIQGNEVDLGLSIWGLDGDADGSIAFLSERGAFWWPGEPKGAKPGGAGAGAKRAEPLGPKRTEAAGAPILQLAGPLDGPTAILQQESEVLVFCADNRVLRFNKRLQRSSAAFLKWPDASSFTTPRFVVQDVESIKSGQLILATNHGLFGLADLEDPQPVRLHPLTISITQVTRDEAGGVLAATRSPLGLEMVPGFELALEINARWKQPSELPISAQAIVRVGKSIFLGTEEGGLCGEPGLPRYGQPQDLEFQIQPEGLKLSVLPAQGQGAPEALRQRLYGLDAKQALAEPVAVALLQDRVTRGAWNETFPVPGEPYQVPGRQCLWAATPNRPVAELGIVHKPPFARLGAKARAEDTVRTWFESPGKGSPDYLYHPGPDTNIAYLDDHGESYSGYIDGPGIRFNFEVQPRSAGILTVALQAFSGMHSYVASLRALPAEVNASEYRTPPADPRRMALLPIPTANGLTHARFLVLNPDERTRAFEFYVDRNSSHNVRLPFAGFHHFRAVPGQALLDKGLDRNARWKATQAWAGLLSRLWQDSRSAFWVQQAAAAQESLAKGQGSAAEALADGLLLAALTLDPQLGQACVETLQKPEVLKAGLNPGLLHRLAAQAGELPRPAPETVKLAKPVLDQLFKQYGKAEFDQDPGQHPLGGWLVAQGVVGRAAAEAKCKPADLEKIYAQQASATLQARRHAGFAYHCAGLFLEEYQYLVADLKNGKLAQAFKVEQGELDELFKAHRASLPPEQQKDFSLTAGASAAKDFDAELLTIARAVEAAVKAKQLAGPAGQQELAYLWRAAKLEETKLLLQKMGGGGAGGAASGSGGQKPGEGRKAGEGAKGGEGQKPGAKPGTGKKQPNRN